METSKKATENVHPVTLSQYISGGSKQNLKQNLLNLEAELEQCVRRIFLKVYGNSIYSLKLL